MELFKLFGTIGLKGVEDTQKQIDDTADHADDASSKMMSAFKKIGGAVVTYFSVTEIVQFGKEIVNVAAEIGAQTSAFEQIMGDYTNSAKEKMKQVADATGVVDSRLTGYMTSMTAKFKGLGYDVDTATTLASDGLMLASDAAAFWDKTLDESTSALNSFLNGSYEGGEAIGLFANDTQMAAYAISQGLVAEAKEWSALDEATKQATRLEYAQLMFEQSGATGQAAKEADQYANVMGNLKEQWKQFQGIIGEPLLQNVVTPAMNALGDAAGYVIEKLKGSSNLLEGFQSLFSELITKVQENIPIFVEQAGTMMSQFGEKIKENLPTVISKALDMLLGFSQTVLENLPKLVASGMEMLKSIVQGIIDSLPTLIQKAPQIIINFANAISRSMQTIFAKGIEIIWNIIKGIISAIPDLTANFPKVIEAIFAVWNAINWLNLGKNLMNGIKNGIKNMSGSLKETATNVFNNFKTSIQNIFTRIGEIIKNPIFSAKTKVLALVGELQNGAINVFKNLLGNVGNVFNSIKNAITSPTSSARDIIKGILNTIKGFFSGFKISIPKIPMPHFSISPRGWGIGDLLKGRIPSLGISWYKKAMDDGMILNGPQIFGFQNGNFLAGGEAGSETVVGTQSLMNMIREASNGNNAKVLAVLNAIYEVLKDDDRIYAIMVDALTDGCKIEWNNRELARMVKKVVG